MSCNKPPKRSNNCPPQRQQAPQKVIIPPASSDIAGLMSPEDKRKLDALPASITGTVPDPLSASIIRAHQLSASYFNLVTGTATRLSSSRIMGFENDSLLITASAIDNSGPGIILRAAGYVEITSSIGNEAPLAGVYIASHDIVLDPGPGNGRVRILGDLSASHFSGGNIQISTATITNQSSTNIKTHILSASYFNVNALATNTISASHFSGGNVQISTATIENITAEILWVTEALNLYLADMNLNSLGSIYNAVNITTNNISSSHFSGGNVQISTATLVNATANSFSATHFSGGNVQISTATIVKATFNAISSSFLSASNVAISTATFSAATFVNETVTNLSATHFSGGNIQISTATIVNQINTTLSATHFSGGNVQISTATFSSLSASKIFVYDLVAQNTNITATMPSTLSLTSLSATHISGGNVQISTATLVNATANSFSSSHFSGGNVQISTATFSSLSSSRITVYDLIAQNTNITATIPSSLTLTSLSATHFSGGNVQISTATITNLSSTNIKILEITASRFTFESGFISNGLSMDGSNLDLAGGNIVGVDSLSATHFSGGNVQISTATLVNGTALAFSATHFSGGNVQISTATITKAAFNAISSSFLSASNVAISTATFTEQSSTRVYVYDLIAQNTNITATIPSSLTLTSLSATHISGGNVQISTATVVNQTNTSLSATHFSGGNVQISTATITRFSASQFSASNVEMSTATIIKATSNALSATHFSGGNVQISTATIVNQTNIALSATHFSGGNVQISTATFSSLSASRITVYDLIVQNSNITGAGGNISASIGQFHQLSASYFNLVSGSITNLSASVITNTSGSDILIRGYGDYPTENTGGQIQIISNHKGNPTTDPYSIKIEASSSVLLHGQWNAIVYGDTGAEINAGESSITFNGALGSTFNHNIDVVGNVTAYTGGFGSLQVGPGYFSTSHFSGGNVQISTATFSSLSASRITVYDLIVQNSNITGAGGNISASIGQFHQLSASYFSMSSGSINNLSATRITNISGSNLRIEGLGGYNGPGGNIEIWSTGSSGTEYGINMQATGTVYIGGAYKIILDSETGMDISSGEGGIVIGGSAGDVPSLYIETSGGTSIVGGIYGDTASFNVMSASRLTVYDLVVQNSNISGSGGNVSASIGQFHQLSASYFSMSSGTINNLSATFINVNSILPFRPGESPYQKDLNLVPIYINQGQTIISADTYAQTGIYIQSDGGGISLNATPSSGSIWIEAGSSEHPSWNGVALRGFNINLSASKSTVISGNTYVENLSASRLTVYDLVVQNSNISGSGGNVSASIGQFHQLSASHFSLVTGTITRFSSSQFSASNVQISTATIVNQTNTALSATHFSGGNVQISTATFSKATFNAISSSFFSASNVAISTATLVNITAVALSATHFSGGNVQISTATFSSLSSSKIFIYDLVAQNTNITATIPDPLSASIIRAHQLSASYFNLVSGSSNNFSATTLSVGNLVANNLNFTGTIDTTKIVSIQVSDPNGSAISTGDGKAYFIIPAQLGGYNLTRAEAGLTTGSTSGTPTIMIRNVTAGVDMLSTAITIDIGDDPATSYTAATPSVINTANDDVQTGEILAVDIDTAGTGAKGLFAILTFDSAGAVSDLTNISASILQTHQLSASYTQITTATITRFSSSQFSASNVQISTATIVNQTNTALSATHFSGGNVQISTATFSKATIVNQSGSDLKTHQLSASYVSVVTASNRSLMLSGVASVSPVVAYVLNTNFSQSASTQQAVPMLSASIAAGEVWTCEFSLFTVMTGTGGVRFTVAAPTGSIVHGFIYATGSTLALDRPVFISGTNAEMGQVFTNVTLTRMPANLRFSVINGANAGTVGIWTRRATSTDTLFISTGSFFIAHKARFGEGNML